jgi:hypothetical protein
MASAILMYFANRLSATFCARDSIQMKAPDTSLGWATGGLMRSACLGAGDRQLRRAAYSFSYPHLFIKPTFQQPVSMQASYRLWQTRCVPQCKRAWEQVERCWADAPLEDIAINGTPTVATRTALKIKRIMTSFSLRARS